MRIQSFGSHYPVQQASRLPAQQPAQATQTSPAFGAKTISFGQTAPVQASNKPSPPLNPNLGRKLDFYA
ncbi:hypothetical protein [Vampirovibrio chlorellavorus]|uniref:hypothetical protein n=1 Tax=Vampirovibrio chlorellavorus TaxID=758823 RepID=UPI0026F29EB4|nr:hypothetical protein [Vampirovibrio chlorellavorus]